MNTKGKIIVVSNRDVHPQHHNHRLFGDDLNPLSPDELNIALAEKNGRSWQLELVTDPKKPNYDKPVSRTVFRDAMRRNADKPWVFFVHGFNQSLIKNLEKCREIQDYGCNVVAFSWPSNPGPQEHYKKFKEYKKARKNARRSVIALNRCVDTLAAYLREFSSEKCQVSISMVVHSLGNFLMQNYVSHPEFGDETSVFGNIILHQPDADTRHHPMWVEKLSARSRVYVTINAHDAVLATSDVVNPDRLGNTRIHEHAEGTTYIDFTWGKGVSHSHRPWHEPGEKNAAIARFYTQVFHGRRGESEPGWEYNASNGNYQLIEQANPFPDEEFGD